MAATPQCLGLWSSLLPPVYPTVRELTPASAEKRLLLLMPPLGGLTNYAYRMNVDNLADLLQVMQQIMQVPEKDVMTDEEQEMQS
ncbi:hypothetical protein WJX82_004500 [Trebouxia sp. C0006]